MALFGKRKKIQQWDLEIVPGVHVGRPKERVPRKAIWNCLPKGVLVFLVVLGSWGGFLSAFDVEYQSSFIGIAFFLTALFFSGLYALPKSWHKDIGYVIYFVFYVMGIYLYRSYVNSGFAVVLNEVRQQGEVYFGINAGDEFAEAVENRAMATTMAVLFIGMFEILVLHIFISNYMSLKLTAFVSLFIYIIPMYFQQEPKMSYVLCLLAGLMGIYIFKNSGHFFTGTNRCEYEQEKKTKVPSIRYTQNSGMYRGVLLSIVGCVLIVGAGSVLFNAQNFRRYYKENPYKVESYDGISGFLMMGWRLFYNGGYTWSGMSGGSLNNISAVRPDETTHLRVLFTPYSKETVYLKAFTGGEYANGHWSEELQIYGESSSLVQGEKIGGRTAAKQLKKRYEEGEEYSAEARMNVIKDGADDSYEYVPYGAVEEQQEAMSDELRSTLGYEPTEGESYISEKTYMFYPNIGYRAKIKDSTQSEHWWVTEDCEDAVRAFLVEAGITAGDPQAVEKVLKYFEEEYMYSYTPGRVPGNQDPINYFLEKNRKGVCVHFASAATLIFRELGIPARYVEGYAIDYNTVLKGEVRGDLKYEDFYDGYSELGETKVMEVEVPGANAHAWVEIYQEGKGWIVVDPTPAVFEEAKEGGFLDSLRELWAEPTDVDLSDAIPEFHVSFLTSNGAKRTVVFIVGMSMLVLVVWQVVRTMIRYRSWHTKDLRKNLLWYYRDMCRKISKKDKEFAKCSVPSEQLGYLMKRYEAKKGETMDKERMLHLFEQICFSPHEPEEESYKRVLKVLKKIRY